MTSLTLRDGWPADWLPPPEYVLALEVAALRAGGGGRGLDDLRYCFGR